MHFGVLFGHPAFVALLLENGARKDIEDAEGKTPVDYAQGVMARLLATPMWHCPEGWSPGMSYEQFGSLTGLSLGLSSLNTDSMADGAVFRLDHFGLIVRVDNKKCIVELTCPR